MLPLSTRAFLLMLGPATDMSPASITLLRYGQGRTRKRTPGQGSTARQQQEKGKGKGANPDSWAMAMSAMQDLASVARSVVEGKGKEEEKKG